MKLKSVAAVKALPLAPGGAALSDEGVLAKVRGVKGIKGHQAQFPGSVPPKVGAMVVGRDGKATPTPDLTRWHRMEIDETEDLLARMA